MSVATSQLHLIMLKEMSFDLSYRLRLAEDLFCEAATAVMAANTFDDFTWKQQASQKVHDYAQTLFVIHDDLIRIHDTQPIIFPGNRLIGSGNNRSPPPSSPPSLNACKQSPKRWTLSFASGWTP